MKKTKFKNVFRTTSLVALLSLSTASIAVSSDITKSLSDSDNNKVCNALYDQDPACTCDWYCKLTGGDSPHLQLLSK
jgi:hypothetical protein